MPAALPLKNASTPPLRHVLSAMSRIPPWLLVIRPRRTLSNGAVTVFDTAPVFVNTDVVVNKSISQ